jgi:rubredoxin
MDTQANAERAPTTMRPVAVTDALVDQYLFELYDNQHNLKSKGQPIGAIAGIVFGFAFLLVPAVGWPIGLFSIALAIGTLRSPAKSEMGLDRIANPKTFKDNQMKARVLAENTYADVVCPACGAQSPDTIGFMGEGGHWTCPSCKAQSLRVGNQLHRPTTA